MLNSGMPIIASFVLSILLGILSWYIPEKARLVVGVLTFGTCALWWLYEDSKRLNRQMGSFTTVIVLLLQPLGMLIWLLRSRKWFGLVAFLVYLIVLFGVGICDVIGYIIGGWINGHSINEVFP